MYLVIGYKMLPGVFGALFIAMIADVFFSSLLRFPKMEGGYPQIIHFNRMVH